MNNTIGATTAISALNSSTSWFSIFIIIGLMTVVILLFVIAISSVTRYKKIRGVILWVGLTFNYFLMGIATLLSLAVPGMVIFYFGKQAVKGNTAPLWMTASIIIGYFLVASIGWLSKKFVVDRVKLFEEEIQKEEPQKDEEVSQKEEEPVSEPQPQY